MVACSSLLPKSKRLCKVIEAATNIPASFEGVFKWIVFLPSVNDIERPVPARYFGALRNGDIKVRGIELRQRSAPNLIKAFQREALMVMASCDDQESIINSVPELARLLRSFVARIPDADADELACRLRIGKTEYTHNIPQKKVARRLKELGHDVKPGMMVSFIFTHAGPVLPSEFRGQPDVGEYTKRLVKSLFVLLQVFGFSKEQVSEMARESRQTALMEYERAVLKKVMTNLISLRDSK